MNYFPFKKKPDENGYVNSADRYKSAFNPESLTEAYKPKTEEPSAPDYAKMSKEYMDQYLTRKPFEFDVNADILYQQYRKQAAESGRMAMEDTMARAAAMTGGYVSSFAQAAGQQALQKELDAADQMIPELYQLARSRYDAEGQDLLTKASAAASMLPGATETTTKGMSVSDAMLLLGSDPSFVEGTTDYQNALYRLVYGGVSDDFMNDKFDSEFSEDDGKQKELKISEVLEAAVKNDDYSKFTFGTDGGFNWGVPFYGGVDGNAKVIYGGQTYSGEELVSKLTDEGVDKDVAESWVIKLQKKLGQIS